MEVFPFLFIVLWLCIIALSLAGFVFWIFALVDCVRRDFPGDNDKLMWILIMLFGGLIGALIYWVVGRPKGALRTS